jgi:hypothetical protein
MYQVYLDVYSNDLDAQEVTFQVWDASEGRILNEVTPSVTFDADGSRGTPSSPEIFNAVNSILQPIILTPGWNWVSFNLMNPKLGVVNNTLPKGSPGDIIKGIQYFEEADNNGNWVGTISGNGGIRNEESYKIKVAQGDTIYHTGEIIDPSTKPVSIVKGWNWVGFISQKNLPVNDALANFAGSNGDIIKGQFSFAVFDSNMGWIGSLQNLEPTKGYMLKAAGAGTLEYPKSGLYKNQRVLADESVEPEKLPWSVNANQYPTTMSMIATVEGCHNIVAEKYILGVFVGDECRGYAKASLVGQTNTYAYFLSVSGNNDEVVRFRLFDKESKKEVVIREEIEFTSDALVGTLNDPFILNPASVITCDTVSQNTVDQKVIKVKSFPNPFEKNISVTIEDGNSSAYNLEIMDIRGNAVYKVKNKALKNGKAQFTWDGKNAKGAEVADGMYIIMVMTETGQVNQKIIKK